MLLNSGVRSLFVDIKLVIVHAEGYELIKDMSRIKCNRNYKQFSTVLDSRSRFPRIPAIKKENLGGTAFPI